MTVGGWFGFGWIVGFIALCIFLLNHYFFESKKSKNIAWGVGAVIAVISLAGMLFYYNGTASGARAFKDQKSNFEKGIDREITITNELTGEVVYTYAGKIDLKGVEDSSYILFEDADGYRQVIYPSVHDIVVIIEK